MANVWLFWVKCVTAYSPIGKNCFKLLDVKLFLTTIAFYSPCKRKKTSSFLMFSGGMERHLWSEMDKCLEQASCSVYTHRPRRQIDVQSITHLVSLFLFILLVFSIPQHFQHRGIIKTKSTIYDEAFLGKIVNS